jgi:hypothetical protein
MTMYKMIADGTRVAMTSKEEKEHVESFKKLKIENAKSDNLLIRNNLLRDSDWTALADCDLSNSVKAKWITYRKGLRNITTHSNWPILEEDDWPKKP